MNQKTNPIIAATGHRLDRLGGNSPEVFARLGALAKASLQKLEPATVISGMALGWDQAIALAAIELSIPLIAAVPFASQDAKWHQEDRDRWEGILFQTQQIIYVDRLPNYTVTDVDVGAYHVAKLQKRNEWMVDNCSQILALYDGSGKGGTFNCLEYAKKLNKPVLNVWDSWFKYSGIFNCTGCQLQKNPLIQTYLPRTFQNKKGIHKSGGKLCIECWIEAFEVRPDIADKLRQGEYIHTTNCFECRQLNRPCCTKCVD